MPLIPTDTPETDVAYSGSYHMTPTEGATLLACCMRLERERDAALKKLSEAEAALEMYRNV